MGATTSTGVPRIEELADALASHDSTLVLTKLTPPRHDRILVRRGSLLQRLTEEKSQPVTVINAAPGAGKTTLLMQWRHELISGGAKVAWYSLDDTDANEAQFLFYLIASLIKAGVRISNSPYHLYQRGKRSRRQSFADALNNECGSLDDDVYVFLDDFHHADQAHNTNVIARLIERAPANFHIVIATRTSPRLPIASWKAHDRITEITTVDLLFDHAETQAFIDSRLPGELDAVGISQLYEATEGWAAALQLAIIAIGESSDPAAFITTFPGASRDVTNFVTTEIIGRLPPALANFLARTSILQRFNPALCAELSGDTDAQATLTELERRNLFIVPLEGRDGWYRYHPMFRDILRSQILNVTDEQLQWLHITASEWFDRHGHAIEAVYHALEAGARDRALDLFERCATAMVEEGQWATLLSWFETLDPADPREHPELFISTGVSQLLCMRIEEAERTLERLRQLDGCLEPPMESHLAMLRGMHAIFIDDSEGALPIVGDLPLQIAPEDTLYGTASCNILAWSYICNGQFDRARATFGHSARFSRPGTMHAAQVYSECFNGLSYVMQGRLENAERLYRAVLDRVERQRSRRSVLACIPASFLAEVVYERGDPDGAFALLADRLAIIRETVLPDGIMRAYITAARARATAGDTDEAFKHLYTLQTVGEVARINRLVAASYAERVRMFLIEDDRAAARAVQVHLAQLVGSDDPTVANTRGETALIAVLSQIRLDLCEGHVSTAAELLQHLGAQFADSGRLPLLTRIHALSAIAGQLRDDAKDAREHTREALMTARTHGFRRSLLDEFSLFEDMFPRLVEPLRDDTEIDALIAELIGNGVDRETLAVPAHHDKVFDPAQSSRVEFTDREHDVLDLLDRGLSNKRIASALSVSVETVKYHLKNIYAKLEVGDRTHAVEKARRLRLVSH
jgi:LuxR family maltose regulon positive regulatory protein